MHPACIHMLVQLLAVLGIFSRCLFAGIALKQKTFVQIDALLLHTYKKQ